MLNSKLTKFLTTGFYSGFAPKASGTFGSLAYCGLVWLGWLVWPQSKLVVISLLVAILLTALSIPVIKKSLELGIFGDNKDPKQIVIDEWAGMAWALTWGASDFLGLAVSFIFFRFFDVIKPYPISKIDKMPGAYGILFDDVLAGIFAAACSYAVVSILL